MYKFIRLMLVLALLFVASCAAKTNTPEQAVDPVVEKQFIEKQVLVDRFGFDKAVVPSRSQQAVETMAARIKALVNYDKVYLTGHADNVGSDRRNNELSELRAQSVADMLEEEGVPSDKITVTGAGASEPITSNKTSDGRAKNRRVEIEVK